MESRKGWRGGKENIQAHTIIMESGRERNFTCEMEGKRERCNQDTGWQEVDEGKENESTTMLIEVKWGRKVEATNFRTGITSSSSMPQSC